MDAGWKQGDDDRRLAALWTPELDPLFWRSDRIGVESAWYGHVPLAQWLMHATAPRCLVELGSHNGVSYAAFCGAVQRGGLGTQCYAVDTWRGDEHAGFYGESVFEDLNHYNTARFAAFSTLIRRTFDDALELFQDGSIDVLHIDGLHTYDAVRHDFEAWKSKLSNKAIVLFHDTNVRSDDFGVWRLWAELRQEYPGFEFSHAHGLGVLGVGGDLPPLAAGLLNLPSAAAVGAVRERFAYLGERCVLDAQLRLLSQEGAATKARLAQSADHLVTLEAKLSITAAENAGLSQELTVLNGELADARLHAADADRRAREQTAAAQGHIQELKAAHETHLSRLTRQQASFDQAVETQLAVITRSHAELNRLGIAEAAARQDRDAALKHANEKQAQLEVALARAALGQAQLQKAEAVSAAYRQELSAARRELRLAREAGQSDAQRRASAEATLQTVLDSSSWKATWPVRQSLRYLPAGVRRPARQATRKLWRAITPHLSQVRRDAAQRSDVERSTKEKENDSALEVAVATSVDSEGAVATSVAFSGPFVHQSSRQICFISGEPETPGSIYRVRHAVEACRMVAYEAVMVPLSELASHADLASLVDAVFVWRAVLTPELESFIVSARAHGARVVFDVDDLMIDPSLATAKIIDGIRSQSFDEGLVQTHFARVQQCMLLADYCTASTPELAAHMRRFGKSAWSIPNGYSQETLRVSRMAARRRALSGHDGLVRLGYAGGSRTHQRDFAEMAPVLARLLEANPHCRLVLFKASDGTPLIDTSEFDGLAELADQIEWRVLVPLHRLPEELARFDINLAPLEVGNPFCEAKSELKYFEGALAGVCTVASPTGPYARAIRDGVTGFLAATPARWAEVLGQLIADPLLRQAVARAALHDVLWIYGPERREFLMRHLLAEWRGGAEGAAAFAARLKEAALTRTRPLPDVAPGGVIFERDQLGEAAVTIVVPLYNYAHTVIEALESAAAQTLTALDLVVVDDASTDNSVEVATAWLQRHSQRFNRVVLRRNHVNSGLSRTRNAAIDTAETPFVLPLDADNCLRPACCEKLVCAIERSGAAFAYPVIQEFGGRSGLISATPWEPNRLVGGNYIDAMALVRKSAWSAVGGYAHLPHGWEDYDFWCMVAELGLQGLGVGGDPLADYRVHESSMLAQVTDTTANKRGVIATLERRHEWLHVSQPLELTEPGSKAVLGAGSPGSSSADRIAQLLPILQCPETGQSLRLHDGALQTDDGRRTWPAKEGCPVLFPGLKLDAVRSFSHLSNEVPESAHALIRASSGWVLNLSAGGTEQRYKNVVEAEAAIFRHTDVVADSHALPFKDGVFEAVIAMNAFEHYRNPRQAAAEIHRVLAPGGRVLIRTAFLQPQHEAPWHFYNVTKFGLLEWFSAFETEQLWVSDNFNPSYALSWLVAECEDALRRDAGAEAAAQFAAEPIGRFAGFWRFPETRRDRLWTTFSQLTQASQEVIAAGFEYRGVKR